MLVLVHRVQLLRGGRAARRHRRGEQPLLRAPGGAVAAVDVVVRDLHGGEVREPVVVFSNVDYDYSIHTIRTIQGVAKRLLNFVSHSVTHFWSYLIVFFALLTVKYGRFFTLVLFGHGNVYFLLKI